MTGKGLRRRLYSMASVAVVILAISFLEYWYRSGSGGTYISSNATLFALLFGAYLAYIFQQRGKFVDDLRKWWNEIVQAKSDFFIYCDKTTPSEEDYLKAFYKLSTAMDTLRLIYCNVDRTPSNPKGYYPFEQVRDIIDIARSVPQTPDVSSSDRAQAKLAINLIFQSLRHAIQSEANATTPDNPTLYGSNYRKKYISEIQTGIGLDVLSVRDRNKKSNYITAREKS